MNYTEHNKPQTKKVINTCQDYPETNGNRPGHNQQDMLNVTNQIEKFLTTMTH